MKRRLSMSRKGCVAYPDFFQIFQNMLQIGFLAPLLYSPVLAFSYFLSLVTKQTYSKEIWWKVLSVFHTTVIAISLVYVGGFLNLLIRFVDPNHFLIQVFGNGTNLLLVGLGLLLTASFSYLPGFISELSKRYPEAMGLRRLVPTMAALWLALVSISSYLIWARII